MKAYAQVGGADKARLFFAKVGGDYAPKMMELLAERYWEDGKALESTRVYKQIIADNMESPRLCEWQSKVLRNSLSLPNYDKALVTQELERLGLVYVWARAGSPRAIGRAAQAGTGGGVPERVPRRGPRAGADLAPRGAEDAGRKHVRSVRARVPAVSGAVRRRQAGLRDALLPRRALVGAAPLERRGGAVHRGGRVEPGRQVHARRGVRGGAGLAERAGERRRAVAPARSGTRARPRRAGRGRGVRQARRRARSRTTSRR